MIPHNDSPLLQSYGHSVHLIAPNTRESFWEPGALWWLLECRWQEKNSICFSASMEKLHMLRYRWQYQYRFQHLRWGPEDCAGGGQFRCQVHFPSLLNPELICRAISVVPLPLNSQELNLADVKSPLKVISQPRSWNQRNWSHMHAHL